MFTIDTEFRIVAPSTAKIEISFVDSESHTITLSDIYVHVDLIDNDGKRYTCVHDPWGSESVNTIVDGDTLILVLENYNLHGRIYSSGYTKMIDPDFESGYDTVQYCREYTNIKIINDGECC